MAALHPELRKLVESTILAAREAAEKASWAALEALAVNQEFAYPSLDEHQRALRNKLRAEARRLGDFEALVAEVSYQQWHRLLFARFLAENDLLIHPEYHAPVSLQDCMDIAEEEGRPDPWLVAAEFAARMLPGVFRLNDPTLQVSLDAAGRLTLEELLLRLPQEVFRADDSLGWVYQFWQAARKTKVNESGRRIGGQDIPPVTQLFTEPYMVEFLLNNTLGAWWKSRYPAEPLPLGMPYLRLDSDGYSAVGQFPDWPARVAAITVLDPCCGSGHFLVAAFHLLRVMRMREEGLSAAEAGDAVLRDNLFGLELDPRCAQIAAFSLCFEAWKSGGYRPLASPNVSCCGVAVGDRVYEWIRLADGQANSSERDALESTLRQLFGLFRNAPDLGSLIDPARVAARDNLLAMDWSKVAPLLEQALERERDTDDVADVFGSAALGVLRAADLLTRTYTLVATNVPYLLRRKQGAILRDYLEAYHPDAKTDLATAFVERCISFSSKGGSVALVTPQSWLSLGSYRALREKLLANCSLNAVVTLGMAAFSDMYWWAFNTALFVITRSIPEPQHTVLGLDVSPPRVPSEKADLLQQTPLLEVSQSEQLRNPDARISLDRAQGDTLLEKYAVSYQGVLTGDDGRYRRCFWELQTWYDRWRPCQSTVVTSTTFGGREHVLDWDEDGRHLARRQGRSAWGRPGVAISQMGSLPASLYDGEVFDGNVSAIVPSDPANWAAIWAFCSSPEFPTAVRRIDQSLKVTVSTLVKVPFDLNYWQQVATELYPDGLPEPHSNKPTQWHFCGHPTRSAEPLQVAVARLLGFRWPEYRLPRTASGLCCQDEDGLDAFSDADGIVCLPPVAGEPPAHERLNSLMASAYRTQWSPTVLEDLLASGGFGGRGLDVWLRRGFFAEHCRVFGNRPFIWHIWDGEDDGFGALVNYHKLDAIRLERLIYTYLGEWIKRQSADDEAGVAGAGRRLKAALDLQQKLKEVAEGEPPYDLYVRWKPLHRQPLGWEPDLDDGVRLNIRPFVAAGVLRSKFTINWNKDRGKNPDGSERHNDLHFTRAQKEAARRSAPHEGAAPVPATSGRLDL